MNNLFVISLALNGFAGVALLRSNHDKWSQYPGWSSICMIPILLISIPNQVHSITSSKYACINNLRQIDGAKEQWAHENAIEGKPNVTLSQIAPFLKDKNPKCPEGGIYTIGKIDDPPKCSIAGHRL